MTRMVVGSGDSPQVLLVQVALAVVPVLLTLVAVVQAVLQLLARKLQPAFVSR
jgi:hypothetical protein